MEPTAKEIKAAAFYMSPATITRDISTTITVEAKHVLGYIEELEAKLVRLAHKVADAL